MNTTHALRPAVAFPPGEYLRDELDERGWTATEFAEIIDRPLQAVSEIMNGKKEITPETAISFAAALGTSAELWLNLQTMYRIWERLAADSTDIATPVERRARLREKIPLSEARKRGWISETKDLDRLEAEVIDLLEVRALSEPPSFALAARRSNDGSDLSIEQIAWLGRLRQLARARTASTFNRDKLSELAAQIPSSLVSGPSGLRTLPQAMASVGVTLIFLPGLKGGKLDGAVTILEDGRPVIGLTGRGDRFDIVVFTLLHECAHLTLGHISAAVSPSSPSAWVDDDVTGEKSDPKERAADEQAAAWTFPGGFEVSSARVPEIVRAAERYSVHPSLVIGRMQHEAGDYKLLRSHILRVRDDMPAED